MVAIAAEALGKYGNQEDLELAIAALRTVARPEATSVYQRIALLVAIDELGSKAAALLPVVKQLMEPPAEAPGRTLEYPKRLGEAIITKLER